MPHIKIDAFGLLFGLFLFLWAGKELDLLPFIYGPAACTQETTP